MVLAKSKNAVGLGNSLMNDRFGKGKGADRKKTTATGIQRTHKDTGETVCIDSIHPSLHTERIHSMSQTKSKRPAGSRCDRLRSRQRSTNSCPLQS